MSHISCLPLEVIELISIYLVLHFPFQAPNQLFKLSITNKYFYSLLSPKNNTQLYANLFKNLFDSNALKRRFPLGRTTDPNSTSSDRIISNQLCNNLLSDAYFERLALFKRMRQFATHPKPIHPTSIRSTHLSPYHSTFNPKLISISRDLWLIHLMILENDDLNWFQLLKAANVTGFLLNYFHYEIYPSATAPGYPPERPEIAIALRLCHLFLDLQDSDLEGNYWTSETGIETYLFALKPYTFASHQYDVAYVPCTIRELPINISSARVLETLSMKLTRREKAALPLPTTCCDTSVHDPLNSWPRTDQLIDSSCISSTHLFNWNSSGWNTGNQAGFQSIPKYSEIFYMGKVIKILPPIMSHVAQVSFFWCNLRHTVMPSTTSLGNDDQADFFLNMMKRVAQLKSDAYDKEFLRLTCCLNAFESPGLDFDLFEHCFQGGWDGQFGFLDLINYREMLGGRLKSIYEGRYGDQNQVFKTREFIVRVRDGKAVKFIEGSREKGVMLTSEKDGERSDSEEGNETSLRRAEKKRWTEVETQESEVEHILRMKSLSRPEAIEPILVRYDPSERYELQIHGAGHSSWGHFQIKGRVRAWDGMLSFLKIYDAGRHGSWLYRGYYAPGDMIVGRWRDTISSEGVDGYEGTFVMFKRN